MSANTEVSRRQGGQVILLMLLLLLSVGAAALVGGLNDAFDNQTRSDTRTMRALSEAKAALIGYALSDANRPGELPCPDLDDDGVSLPGTEYVGNSCATLRGWLPWRTLDLGDVRDHSGARLWYAVSDAFHANDGGVLNPDTVGGLSVDGGTGGDLVAVIIAPGEPLGSQARPGGATAANAPSQVGAYLEGANTDADLTSYATAAAGDFNDRVVYITAQELLRAAEKRVVGEVAAALWQYRNAYGAYPWVSPYADPASGAAGLFDSMPGARVGHVALTDAASEAGEVQDTGYTITWTRGDATVTALTDSAVSGLYQVLPADFVTMQAAVDGQAAGGTWLFPTLTAPSGGNPSCTIAVTGGATPQVDYDIADCSGTALVGFAGYNVTVTLPAFGLVFPDTAVFREYTFDVDFDGSATIAALDGARVRNVDSGAAFQQAPAAAPSTVTIRDYLPAIPGIEVSRRVTYTTGSTGTLNLTGIYAEVPTAPAAGVGALPGDLPDWFFAQQWNRYVLVEYAANAVPNPAGSPQPWSVACTPGGNCVGVNYTRYDGATIDVLGNSNDWDAVVIGAGPETVVGGTAQNRGGGSATLGEYFESVNANTADGLAERRLWTSLAEFNDQVQRVEFP